MSWGSHLGAVSPQADNAITPPSKIRDTERLNQIVVSTIGLIQFIKICGVALYPKRGKAGVNILPDYTAKTQKAAGRTGGFAKSCFPNMDYMLRSAIIFLISVIASAGFKPFGQVLVQFMIV